MCCLLLVKRGCFSRVRWEGHWSKENIPKVHTPLPPQKEREPEENLHITPAWPENTLKLGWWDTGDRAAFQKVGSLRAGEFCVVHQRCVGDTTVKGLAAHNPVPVPRGTREQNFLLETESFLLSKSHKKAYQNSSQDLAESWWLFVQIFTTGKMILPPSLFTSCLNVQFHNGTPLQYLCLENPMGRGGW